MQQIQKKMGIRAEDAHARFNLTNKAILFPFLKFGTCYISELRYTKENGKPGQAMDIVIEASRVNVESCSVPDIRCHKCGK